MTVDPFRLAIALVPVAAYVLLLGLVNLRRRPFLTSGGCDLTALGVALSGLMFVGPLELFRPEAATRSFGNYIWLFLVLFYWLWLVLVVLLSRPRLVIYNISAEELHPMLAEAAARLDPAARWAGNQFVAARLGVQLHLDSFDMMRNVSLVVERRPAEYRRLAALGARAWADAASNAREVESAGDWFLVVSLALLCNLRDAIAQPPGALMQAMNEVFAY